MTEFLPRFLVLCGVLLASVLFSACAPAKQDPEIGDAVLSTPSIPKLLSGEEPPPAPDEVGSQMSGALDRWWYGSGLGKTLVNVGGIVVFPPYAIYLFGNAGLQLAGLQPLYVTDALPDRPREGVLEAYEAFTSIPGRVNSFVAGRE